MRLPRWRRRWTRWALIASLGLNVAAVGIIGGAMLKGPPPPDPGPGPALWPFARALPAPYRGDLAKALRDTRKDWIGTRRAMGNLSLGLATALRSDPFDPEAVRSILAEQLEFANELGMRGTDLLLAQIVRMSPEDRAAYAAALQEKRGRKSPH